MGIPGSHQHVEQGLMIPLNFLHVRARSGIGENDLPGGPGPQGPADTLETQRSLGEGHPRRSHLDKPRQHLCYVYASLSRLDFRGLLEKDVVVFEGLTGFVAVKKPTALMMHWWNGGRGGV